MYETRGTTVTTVDGDLGHLSLIVDTDSCLIVDTDSCLIVDTDSCLIVDTDSCLIVVTDSCLIVDADLGHLSLIPCALAPLPPPLPLPLALAPLVRLPFPCLPPNRLAAGNLSPVSTSHVIHVNASHFSCVKSHV